ncbi:energy transducer TonB [Candidatus Desantisbacteria bacterium]|nr:energy transducer TonB [Candidatus Desantisbacteria bacterium]
MNKKQFINHNKTKSINNGMSKGIMGSLIIHTIFVIFLITTPVSKKKDIIVPVQKKCEKVLRVISIKNFDEPVKTQITKKGEKIIVKKDLEVKTKELIVEKIEMKNVTQGSQNIGIKAASLKPQQVMQDKVNTNDEPAPVFSEIKETEFAEKSSAPSKIVLSESAFDSKASLKISFNQSEVVKGKKTWIGNAVGTGNLSAIKNSQKSITKLQNTHSNVDKYNSTYNANILDSTNLDEFGTGIYEASKLDNIPEIKEYVEPLYPELARRMGIEGKVLLKLLINHEGKVKKIEPIGNLSKVGFEEQASIAVKKWKFSTPTINGNPVSIWFVLPLAFSLN